MKHNLLIVILFFCCGVLSAQETGESHSPLTATVVVTKDNNKPVKKQNTQPLQETKKPDYSSLFHGDYEKTNFELQIGYVNKSWLCTYASVGTQREDFWGDPGKYFHGIQVGGLYTPSFDWGLGLRTGLYFEVYTSTSYLIRSFCNYFTEIDLYIPVHASYRIPFTSNSSITFFGGVSFQWAMDGKYFQYRGWSIVGPWFRPYRTYYTSHQVYGVDGWPHQVNWQGDVGASIRINRATINFTYSFGLNEHGIMNTFDGGETYETAIKSRQGKMQASIAIAI